MTTIIGIQAKDGIALVSDTQLTVEDDEGGLPASKEVTAKIPYGGFWAMAYVGTQTERLMEFFNKLKEKQRRTRHLIYKAVQRKNFPEVLSMNKKEMAEGAKVNDINAFLLATTSPERGLWRIDEYGILHRAHTSGPVPYLSLGSGSKYAVGFIDAEIRGMRINPEKFDLENAAILAYGALKNARAQDLNTSGTPDMVLLTRRGVIPGGEFIEDYVRRAEERVVKRFISKHT